VTPYCSDGDWPFPLVVNVESENRQYHHTPKSEFYFTVNDVPHLVCEVQSDASGQDRVRMILQAACVVRLQNFTRKNSDDPFVLMALYFNSPFQVEQHLFFQMDPSNATEVSIQYLVSSPL
jgi:hypothetical protein